MSMSDRIEDEYGEREEGELYPVSRQEWYVLEDHEGEPVLSCENPVEVKQ